MYPSKTPAAQRAESKARRDKQKELLQQVNEKLAPQGLTHDALLRGIVDGTVEVTIKEKQS